MTAYFCVSELKMSAVCVKNSNSVKRELWSSIFSDFGTEGISSVFMKQLTTICISTILHLREILPDDYFETKNFKGIPLKLLKSEQNHPVADKIQYWLKGAFEAIDKKYLKQLMLVIKDGESKMTLETYTITFNYQNGNEKLDVSLSKNNANKKVFGSTATNTKLKTIRLLQMCHTIVRTYSSLPSRIVLSICLSYYQNTPEDYQPRGFKGSEPKDLVFPKDTRSVEIGITETKHHSFKLVNKSCFNDNFLKNMKSISKNNSLEEDKINNHDFSTEGEVKNKDENERPSNLEVPDLEDKDKPTVNKSSSGVKQKLTKICEPSKQPVEYFFSKEDENLNTIQCPCCSTEESEIMFCCYKCKCQVHAECFGVLQFDISKKIRFYCHMCHQPEGKEKCFDKVMISLKNSSDQQKLALLRRVLKFCFPLNIVQITLKKMGKIAGPNCSRRAVQIVLNKMVEIGVAVQRGKRRAYLIDKVQLKNVLFHYFYRIQSSENVPSKESSPKRKTFDSDLSGNTSKDSPATLQTVQT